MLFAVTRSAFTLVFALLGPVVAVASSADAALHARRSRRSESARFASELATARAEVTSAHRQERDELERRFPSAARLGDHGSPPRSIDPAKAVIVRLGTGTVPSGFELGSLGPAPPDAGSELGELRALAARLVDAPVTSEVSAGIGFVGPRAIAVAAARGAVLQLAARLGPDAVRVEAPDDREWEWLAALPQAVDFGRQYEAVRFVAPARSVTIATASREFELPVEIAVVIRLDGAGSAGTESVGVATQSFSAELLSAESAALIARGLGERALRLGERTALARFPDRVAFDELDQDAEVRGIAARIGVDSDGALLVDLVSDGPHAIVGGTTGSGKSELLVTWILAMATDRSPAEVTFLFVDFKGGSAFDPLAGLPHSVGIITDLDADHALRALTSLGAELRRRERLLAEAGLRAIDDRTPPPFPRLVVVVDEYASLVDTHSGLGGLFTDIAARGRSLGVHLILCTQRPAGVVRDAILANAPLRLCLRVMTATDSSAVIGSDVAASLPPHPRGRAYLSASGQPPRLFQVAMSTPADAERIALRWASHPAPRRPWLPPLPDRVRLGTGEASVPADDLPFALADRPGQQSQPVARYRPAADGSLLVVGAATSGKSGVLAAMAAAPSTVEVQLLPGELPQLWDALLDAGTRAPGPRVLLLDDLDAILARCDEQYRAALIDLLSGLLRDGPGVGVHLVITVQRITGSLQSIAGLCGSLLLLRMPSRQEHVLAGGSAPEFLETRSPGAGHWQGHRIQVFEADATVVPPMRMNAVEPCLDTDALAVVSTRPERFAERIRLAAPMRRIVVIGPVRPDAARGANQALEVSAGGSPDILIGDPEGWQANWSLLASLLRSSEVLFDGCSLGEVRTITRSRELPPPFPRGERPLWLHRPGGELVRVRLP